MAVPTGYQPSQYAKVWSIIAPNAPGGSAHLALDIIEWSAAFGPNVDFALLMQAQDGSWNYLGNMPPAQPNQGNIGLLWSAPIGSLMTYTPPGGTPIQGDFTAIGNQVRDDMILAWLAYIKQIIQQVLFGTAPPASGWPAADWQGTTANLRNVLQNKIEIVNGYPVVKP